MLWELIVHFKVVSPRLVPSPLQICFKLYHLTTPKPILQKSLFESLLRLILGYGLGALLGISVGILMGISKPVYRAFSPILSLLISVPTLAWVPLLLVTLGIGNETIVFTIFLGGFFPIVYNTMNGIRGIEKQLVWASHIMGAGKIAVFFDVFLPGALVSIITGLRLAIGYSWRALVGAEMLAAGISSGVGHMIYAARAFADVEAMFAGLVIIAIGGLLMDRLIMDPIERRTVEKWGMVKER
jgi:NitT/TauT family transport system permease protein